ncbi:hypothetical protein [Brevibacillus sp. FIR094]|uniref:hypothetical protein n=1 Tax=Brevibacillus sp. FIR094 TaxID=3134809 RepID=UPI003D1EAF73
MNNRTATYSFLLGTALLLFMATIVLSTSVLFLFGVSVTAASFWIGLVAALAAMGGMVSVFVSSRRRAWFFSLLAGVVIVSGISYSISANTFDLSFDGQTYHQEAIVKITNGWNPVHDQPIVKPSGSKEVAEMVNREVLSAFHLWINHYAKGPWMLDAVMYKLTGQIEISKIFNLLLIASSFFLTLAAIQAAFPEKKGAAIAFALLAAFNPAVITQSTSFYIDGQLGSLVLIICALSYLLYKRYHAWTLLALCATLMLLAQIKFTALGYAGLLGLAILVLFFFYDRRQHIKSMLVWLSVSLVITVGVVGYNPYVTNTLTKGHPFYPLAGKGAVDIMTSNSPHGFKDNTSIENLAISLFSKSENIATPHSPTWKVPFTVTWKELAVFFSPDVRVAGFGPLFGGAMIVTCLILVALLLGTHRKKAAPFLWISLALFVTVLINPESWWARYVPQLWLIPLLIALAVWDVQKGFFRHASKVLVVILLANMVMVNASHIIGQAGANALVKKQLEEIKASNKTLVVDFHHFNAVKVRLQEAGIPFIEQKLDKGEKVKGFMTTRAIYLLK